MIRRVSLSLLACVGLLGAQACKSESTPPAEAPQTTAGTPTPDRQFTAGDTFGVLRSIHAGEVDQAQLAQKKASDPRVRAYAEKVINDHQARTQKENQLMSGLGITPRDSDASNQIKSEADRETANLQSLSGTDFDRTFLDDQVGYYRMVIDTFDRQLLPNARDPQIRATLQMRRQQANDRLLEAQDLRNSIAMTRPAQ